MRVTLTISAMNAHRSLMPTDELVNLMMQGLAASLVTGQETDGPAVREIRQVQVSGLDEARVNTVACKSEDESISSELLRIPSETLHMKKPASAYSKRIIDCWWRVPTENLISTRLPSIRRPGARGLQYLVVPANMMAPASMMTYTRLCAAPW